MLAGYPHLLRSFAMTVKTRVKTTPIALATRNFRIVPTPNFHKYHMDQYVNWITQPTLLRALARQAHLLTLKL
jgi:hypothetical protein